MRPQRGGRELSPAALQAQFLAVFAAGRCREQVSQNLANHAHALRLDDTEAADEYEGVNPRLADWEEGKGSKRGDDPGVLVTRTTVGTE